MGELLGYLKGEDKVLFWSAALAIATGGTLLLTAAFLLVRGGLRRSLQAGGLKGLLISVSGLRPAPASPTRSAKGIGPGSRDRKAPTGATEPKPGESHDHAPRAAAAAGGGEDVLLRRLRAAGDRLERMAGAGTAAGRDRGVSALKDSGPDVEYVFKANRNRG